MRNPYQLARLFTSLARMTTDVGRLERVLEINDALMKLRSPADSDAVVEEFRRSPRGAEALRERYRLGPVDLRALAATPAETLGGAYARFMLERSLKPEDLPELQACSEVEYLVAHMYETHDLWHVVTGFDTDLPGEIALQAFYLAQQRSYLPFFALAAVFLNTAVYAYEEKSRRLDALAEGWQLGKRAESLVGIDWRQQLGRSLKDVRRDLGLDWEGSAGGPAS